MIQSILAFAIGMIMGSMFTIVVAIVVAGDEEDDL